MTLPPVVRLMVRNFVSNLDPITLLVMFGQPAFLIVILGTMFNQLIPSVGASGSYVAFLVPGMIASQMITGAVLAGRIFWLDRRWSMVEQLFSGPFERAEYLAALLGTALLFSLVGVGIMVLVALPLIGVPGLSPIEILVVLGTIALGSLFFGGLLIGIGSRIRSANLYFTIQSVLQYFLIFISTVYYPVTAETPTALRIIVYGNPLTYAANTVRDAFTHSFGPGDLVAGAVLSGLAVAAFGLAVLGFRRLELGPVQ
ncbi:membrane protein containing ABC-2 type transporter domain protein [mine drainage metagenome]|uniref:Membrane protein containing ABC-2 type transporter domain protein n=2 Tax=mine drainage metagenome TaxID=410659 RepID=T1CUW4_9ZZZZ